MALETLQPGTVLGGRYKLGSLMGHGGMGSVYEAIQLDLGRRVALKVLDPRLALDPAHVERFRREAHAAASLGHPNIVQVTDFSWQPGSPPYLVMEHLQGQSLAQLMDRTGPLGGRHVAVIATQALDALGAAHRAGIVHRDIKPDNLFLVQVQALGEVVKLLDFGIAKLVEGAQTAGPGSGQPITSTGTMLGTPAYMAPEQARGAAIDHRADLYALGACMYHALSGGLPFSATSAPAMLFAIVEQQPVPLAQLRPDLPPGLCAIVARAMAKDPNARFASADEMRAALAPFAGGPSLMPPASLPRSDGREAHAPTYAAPPGFTPASGTGGPLSPMATPSLAQQPGPSTAPPQFSVPAGVPVVMGQPTLGGVANPTPAPPTAAPPAKQGGAGVWIAIAIVAILLLGGGLLGLVFWLKSRDATAALALNGPASAASANGESSAPPASAVASASGAPTATHWTPPTRDPSAANTTAGGGTAGGTGSKVAVDAKGVPTPSATVAAGGGAIPQGAAPIDLHPTLAPPPRSGPYPMSGKTMNQGGGQAGTCKDCDFSAWSSKLHGPPYSVQINGCYSESQWESPVHEDRGYFVRIDGKGTPTDVWRNTAMPSIPRIDACIARVLLSLPMPMRGPSGGDVQIYMGAECDIGWHDHCQAMGDAGAKAPKN